MIIVEVDAMLTGSKFAILKSGVTMATGAYNEVVNALPEGTDFQEAMQGLLARHVMGDWGDVCAQDAKENEKAVKSGARILSCYTVEGIKLYVISDAAWSNMVELREVTTILRPEDY